MSWYRPTSRERETCRALSKKAGEGLYGAVFRVSDIEVTQEHLAARAELKVLGSASGATSVFYHPEHFSGVLVVLTEYPHPLERETNYRGEG